MSLKAIVVFSILISLVPASWNASIGDAVALEKVLLRNYSKNIRPLLDQDQSILVNVSFFLLALLKLDMVDQVLESCGFLTINWRDETLWWNKTEYGGISKMFLRLDDIWTPALFVCNTAAAISIIGKSINLLEVSHEGSVTWIPGDTMRTTCKVNTWKYPFDTQSCNIKICHWFDGADTVNISLERKNQKLLDFYETNGEWDIREIEETIDYFENDIMINITIKLARKWMFYVITLLAPIWFLSLLNILVFLLPPESGEKVSLSTTILLSYIVLLGNLGKDVPKNSETVPILSIYITIFSLFSTMSILFSVVISRLFLQSKFDRPRQYLNPFAQNQVLPFEISDKNPTTATTGNRETVYREKRRMLSRRLDAFFFWFSLLTFIFLSFSFLIVVLTHTHTGEAGPATSSSQVIISGKVTHYNS